MNLLTKGRLAAGSVLADLRPGLRMNRTDKYVYERFMLQPVATAGAGYGNPTGSTGDTNLFRTDRNSFEYHIKGAGQTLVAPALIADGLNVALDQTADEGVELSNGITARARAAFLVGTDGPLFARLRFKIEDVSGTDDCAFGWRKAEAYQAAIDDYNDMAVLNVISGTVKTETILANAATVTTTTGKSWADGEVHTLEVRVAKNGAVSYYLDGSRVQSSVAYSFASGLTIVPFFYFLHDTDLAGVVALQEWECGYLDPR